MIIATTAYAVGALVTGSVIQRANRVSEIKPTAYMVGAAALWPAWWVMYGLTDTH